jgi:hypothetical protein
MVEPWESGEYGRLILAIPECLTFGDFSLTASFAQVMLF